MMLLVVGDEMNSTVPFLEKSGYECVTAPGVRRALSAVTRDQPDLVVTDFNLPDGIGFDIIQHVRRVAPKTPVILASEDAKY
jgi:DNA-binding NtrC family response regulator